MSSFIFASPIFEFPVERHTDFMIMLQVEFGVELRLQLHTEESSIGFVG
jgi:hypothetical protein